MDVITHKIFENVTMFLPFCFSGKARMGESYFGSQLQLAFTGLDKTFPVELFIDLIENQTKAVYFCVHKPLSQLEKQIDNFRFSLHDFHERVLVVNIYSTVISIVSTFSIAFWDYFRSIVCLA